MFQQMSALASLSDTRNQQRQSQSEKYLVTGMTLLQQAKQEGFSQTLRLQEAAGALIEAIRFNRSDIRPYLALAYVFMLIEDHMMAQKYVHQALSIDPGSQLVRQIQQRVAQDYQRVSERRQTLRHSPSPARSEEGGQTPAEFNLVNFDFDAQYDATESRIRHLLREVMQAGLPAPVSDAKDLSQLRQKLQKQVQNHETICKELAIIDAEIDCSDLQRLLKPIEAHLKRSEQVLNVSLELIQLAARISEETVLVEQICEEARNTQDAEDLEVLEENLEACLDNADGYAGAIETFLNRYPDLSHLEGLYQTLQDRIESYQEALEEAHTRLGA